MVTSWVNALLKAETDIDSAKVMLGDLAEHESTKLLRFKPLITVLTMACEFIIANLKIIRKLFTPP